MALSNLSASGPRNIKVSQEEKKHKTFEIATVTLWACKAKSERPAVSWAHESRWPICLSIIVLRSIRWRREPDGSPGRASIIRGPQAENSVEMSHSLQSWAFQRYKAAQCFHDGETGSKLPFVRPKWPPVAPLLASSNPNKHPDLKSLKVSSQTHFQVFNFLWHD